MRGLGFCLSIVATFAVVAPIGAQTDAPRSDRRVVVELAPHDPPSWSWTRVFAPVTGLFLGGPGYWYAPRVIEIETRPPGALVDLFYVRRNFQKRFEQVEAPATLVLPSRIDATPQDSVVIRAQLDGHRRDEVRVEVRSRTDRVTIELAPLPNRLVAFAHTYFAGRAALIFTTEEPVAFRLQRAPQGFRVILPETRITPEARAIAVGGASAFVDALRADQVGEDLIVSAALAERVRAGALVPRRRQWEDFSRGLYVLSLEFALERDEAAYIERAQRVLAGIGSDRVSGCALVFDALLRDALDPAALLRALAPRGAYTDPYTRAAMKRLGEISPGGVIHMRDGSRFRGSIPVELSAAASQPGDAIGYLALLRAFVDGLEPESARRSALRSLSAPELHPAQFDAIVDAAEQRERECADRTSARGGIAARD
jgi:hypothetical protein